MIGDDKMHIDVVNNISTDRLSFELAMNDMELEALTGVIQLALLMNEEMPEENRMMLPATTLFAKGLAEGFRKALQSAR